MAYVVVLNLKAMVIRAGTLAFLGLVAAAYAEDRFYHQDWRYFLYAAGGSVILFFLSYCCVRVIAQAISPNR